jgi:uncharacterized repeat protein (TIGR01451 family)
MKNVFSPYTSTQVHKYTSSSLSVSKSLFLRYLTPLKLSLFAFLMLIIPFNAKSQLVIDQTSLSGTSVFMGQYVYYEIKVTNNYSFTVSNINIQDIIPANFNLNSICAMQGFNFNTPTLVGNTLTATSTSLPGGGAWGYIRFAIKTNNNYLCSTPPIGSNYAITNTSTIISSSVGGGMSDATTVSVWFPPTAIIANNITSSSLGNATSTVLNNAVIHVTGTFTINNNCEIRNCIFKMAAGSQILVQGGSILTAEFNHFYSCSNLWQGIRITTGTLQYLRYSTIEDAQIGLHYDNANPSNLGKIEGNYFTQNFTAIQLTPISNTYYSPKINSNLIEGSTILQNSNPNFPNYGYSYAGLVLTNAQMGWTGISFQQNQFKNLCNGIIAYNSDIFCKKNTFEGIKNYAPYFLFGLGGGNFNGSGIYQQGGNIKILGDGVGSPNAITFNNCDRGIATEQTKTDISSCRILQTIKGIYCGVPASAQTIIVEGNEINVTTLGIEIRQSDLVNTTLNGNYITVGALPTSATSMGGIRVVNFNGTNNSAFMTTIKDNTINVNRAKYGIHAESAGKIQIIHNFVYLNYSQNNNEVGINLVNSNNALIQCDSVRGVTATGTATTYMNSNILAAISIENSTGWEISYNKTKNTTLGFRFKGDCSSPEKFIHNKMYEHYIGLYLFNTNATLNTKIGRQTQRGNRWLSPNYGLNSARADVPQLYLPFSQIFVGGLQGTSQYYPNNISPATGWFQGLTPGTPVANSSCIYPPIIQPIVSGDSVLELTPWDYQILNNQVTDNNYPDEAQYYADRYLYNKLAEKVTQIPAVSLVQEFYQENEEGNIGKFTEVNETYASTQANAIDNNRQAIETLQHALAENDSLISVTTDSLTLANLQNENLALNANLQNLLAIAENLANAKQAEQAENADLRQEINETIIDSVLVEANEKIINNIYLSTIARGVFTFTSEQLTDIENIAFQCIPLGGVGVYKARSLRSFIFGDTLYNDSSLCAPANISWRTSQTTKPTTFAQAVYLSPNPASDAVSILILNPLEKDTEAIIYDAMGKMVKKITLSSGETKVSFSIKELPSGTYYLQAFVNEQFTTTKFVILK